MSGKTPLNAHLWERHPDDWYVEERAATAELLRRESFRGCVWDPACGRGHILAEAQAAGYETFGSDIADRARVVETPFVVADFLTGAPFALGDSVIMNPPFRGGDADTGIEGFVRQAMRYGSVAMIAAFIPARFLWGGKRARAFWTVRPPSRVYMITPRPSCPPGPVWESAPEDVGGGTEDFAWAVWERDDAGYWPSEHHDPAQLFWITAP